MTRTTPSAGVLSVGSELLLGDLTDTNATWISAQLKVQGVEVIHHVAARDELHEIVRALRWLAAHVDLIVIGGGLGPTADDLTREAVAAAAQVPLRRREELEATLRARFASMGRAMAPQNVKQADIPEGATIFPAVGTAPAFALTLPGEADTGDTRLIALPGVPWELHELWQRHVVDEVRALGGTRVTVTRIVHVVGRGESDVASIVEPLLGDRPGSILALLARKHEIEVRLTVSADDLDAAARASQPLVDEVVAALGDAVVGVDEQSLEELLLRLLIERDETVATAESATGGDIAARLARIPGAGDALLGGAVVYSIGAKHDLAGVDPAIADQHGAVSAEVTEALAIAIRERTGASWGLAVTGVAGPSSVDGLPVGTCYWAVAHCDGTVQAEGRQLPGDRIQILARLGTVALDLLRRRLQAG